MRRALRCMLRGWAATLAVVLASGPGQSVGASLVGDPVPEFTLADVETGRDKQAAAMIRGAVGAIVYMQTSCAACRKELMALKDLQAKYPQLRVVVVSVDSGNPARVRRYMEHFEFAFPFLHDPEFKTPEMFGFSFTPALVLADRQGKIALLKGGYRPGDEVQLEQRITTLLAQ